MNEELRPCPFCGAMPEKLRTGYMCSTLGCALQENTVSEKEWNTRPIEDALNARIAELEKDLSNKEIDYTDLWDDALALQARIAELEAEIDMLKQLSQPIEFWSDEKIQIYKSNESRTMKSGYEEREE